jgi:hypothetical protein
MRGFRMMVWLAAAASNWAADPVLAQGVTDEGSFTISIGGRTAGRENFRISAVTRPGGGEFLAKADAAYGDRRISPELRTDAKGTALEYIVVRRGDDAETWHGIIARGRLSATITSSRGPSAREFIVPPGSVILDDDLLHQHYFVIQRTRDGRVPIIVPHRNTQTTLRVTTVGTEPLLVGTRELNSTHLRLEEPSGERRDVWVDEAGRVLKIEIAARRLVAVRDDPPRD